MSDPRGLGIQTPYPVQLSPRPGKQSGVKPGSFRAGLRQLHDGELVSASSLGASRSFVALRIGLPSLSGVLGIVFLLGCWATLIELSVAMLLIQTPPLPVSLHLFRALLSGEHIQTPASQALLLVLLTAALVLILWWLTHRVCSRIARLPRHLSSPARTHA